MRDIRGVKRGYCKDCEKDECPEFIQGTTDSSEKVSNLSCAYCGHLPVKHARCTSPTGVSDNSRAVVVLDFKTEVRNSHGVAECSPATTTEEYSSRLTSEVENVQSCSSLDTFCNSTDDDRNFTEQERNSSEKERDTTDYNSRLLQEIFYLKTILKEHGTMMRTLLNAVNAISDRPMVTDPPSNRSNKSLLLPVPLPLTSHLNLMIVEDLLEDERIHESLCLSLAQIGGLNLGNAVRRIMRKLMTNELAMEFSWLGAKEKLPFLDLKLCKVVFDAIRRNNAFDGVKDSDIEKSVRDWLRHAKARSHKLSISK